MNAAFEPLIAQIELLWVVYGGAALVSVGAAIAGVLVVRTAIRDIFWIIDERAYQREGRK